MNNMIDELDSLLHKFEWVDLSRTLENGVPKWPSHPSVIVDPTRTHAHDGYYCQTLIMGEHSISHVDCPAHAIADMAECTIDTYPVSMFCGPAITYSLKRFDPQAGERVTLEQLQELEADMGDAAGEGDIVLLDFGWAKYWATDRGWEYYSKNEPGLTEEAAKYFADKKVKVVGCDTVACDTPMKDYVVGKGYGHDVYWLRNGIFIMEMLCNLDKLPARSYVLALPLSVKNGSGAPMRIAALVEK